MKLVKLVAFVEVFLDQVAEFSMRKISMRKTGYNNHKKYCSETELSGV